MSFRTAVISVGILSLVGVGLAAPVAVASTTDGTLPGAQSELVGNPQEEELFQGLAAPASVASTSYGTLPGARSELVGNSPDEELFLGGNYIELGISKLGNFGTQNNKPDEFFGVPSSRLSIGMTADYDGFNSGNNFPIDFFLPGSPEERYNFGFKVGIDTTFASYSTLAGDDKSANLSRPSSSDVVITNESLGSTLKGKVITSIRDVDGNVIAVLTQTISFGVDDMFFTNSIKIQNSSGTTWDSVRYMRNVDPDNGKDQGADYTTDNEVISTIVDDGAAVVRAQIQAADSGTTIPTQFTGSMAPLIYYSKDLNARASTYGFYNPNPYDSATPINNFDNPRTKNELSNADEAINITIERLNLSSGSSFTTNYITSLDQRDFSVVEELLEDAAEAAANPTPQKAVKKSVKKKTASVVEISIKSIKFNKGTSQLTPAAKKKLKKNLSQYKTATSIKITGGAGYLPGVTKSQVEKLAKNRAKSIERYLKSKGVKQADFKNAIKTFRIGKIPSTKIIITG